MLKVKYIDKREPINVEVMVDCLINFNRFSGAASGDAGGVAWGGYDVDIGCVIKEKYCSSRDMEKVVMVEILVILEILEEMVAILVTWIW